MRETTYQGKLIGEIKKRFPGAIVLKNDTSYQQGIPDLSVFFGPRWATLEVKIDIDADEQPNQGYWVARMNDMSYSSFIYPQNEVEVLRELQHALEPRRHPRFLKSE